MNGRWTTRVALGYEALDEQHCPKQQGDASAVREQLSESGNLKHWCAPLSSERRQHVWLFEALRYGHRTPTRCRSVVSEQSRLSFDRSLSNHSRR